MPPAPIIAMLTLLFAEAPACPMEKRGKTTEAAPKAADFFRKERRFKLFIFLFISLYQGWHFLFDAIAYTGNARFVTAPAYTVQDGRRVFSHFHCCWTG
jgi:hypothetical protein